MKFPDMHQYIILLFSLLAAFFTTQNPSRRRGTGNGWLACSFRAGLTIAGDRPPRYGLQGRLRFTVGRGPVPRHASVGRETALVGARFSRGSTIAGDRPPRYGPRRGSPQGP